MSVKHDPAVFVVRGRAARTVQQRLNSYRWLIEECDELRSGTSYGPDTRVRVLTFLQIAFFGYDRKHCKRYGGKFERNCYLAAINPNSIGVSYSARRTIIRLEASDRHDEFDLGFISGATLMYPLNARGLDAYRENRLPPHEFDEQFLSSTGERSSGVHIGGALYIPTFARLLLNGPDYLEGEPGSLAALVGRQMINFSPDVNLVDSADGPSLLTTDGGPLPCVVTQFGGRGHGEDFVQEIGFAMDERHPRCLASKDRRFSLDLNELHRASTPRFRRADLLAGWGWALQFSPDKRTLGARLIAAAKALREGHVDPARRS